MRTGGEMLIMNAQTLCDIARLHRSETLRRAASQRRARLIPRRAAWRRRAAVMLTAAGVRFLTLGTALADSAE
ncbi:MAG: hypothetical protein JO060_09840 [Candidatus Eremiobacteraeota bacterium]|nr:hypothetical protein [Candidatus Eremiobacteraeota bacterium]